MKIIRDFVRDERAVAFVEYLSLLGLLVSGVIVAVAIMGLSMGGAYRNWGHSFESASVSQSPSFSLSDDGASGSNDGSDTLAPDPLSDDGAFTDDGSDTTADVTGDTTDTVSGPGNSGNANGNGNSGSSNGNNNNGNGNGKRKP